MLNHLARTGTAAHTDIFDCAAETGHFVSLEVIERNKNIRIHDCTADAGGFDIFSIRNGNFHIIRTLQAVSDDDMATGGVWGETILISAFDMIECIFAMADIKRIAVCKKRLSSEAANLIRYGACEVRAQK